ncbi:hypothetical protein PTSG_08537 [Salpingoeca rosetta]|uniref:mannosyl-glycoprotein endo-beta-N-acetylglucosaminidase n=1 Tax=Salpingoeca rosetta (strain ATCC 50818 / BSB-021) TaxID=946362 RepID=F2UJZ1_SALR5|nr:uncharacterized protein PTSG_08537 [Salpingoeca rosetta]EGD77440.1 hypothetical protein PTSG_08537 [Salpingoeca rosetta]|eukprot:XP_004990328.1 hypothetical protein PTSG_08537 [Salpingoeca rosetta]
MDDNTNSQPLAVLTAVLVLLATALVLLWWRKRQQQQQQQQQQQPKRGRPPVDPTRRIGAPRQVPQASTQSQHVEPATTESEQPAQALERSTQVIDATSGATEPATTQTHRQGQVHMVEQSRHAVVIPECKPLKTLIDLLAWNAGSEFCCARVPLRPRLTSSANKGPRLLVCHDMMGGYKQDHLPQGQDDANIFTLLHWHLMDTFVYFAHDLVSLPPPTWTNLAHINGVKVLGTFITEWDAGHNTCAQLLKDEHTRQLAAEKLAAIMHFHKFEGWLVNIENDVSNTRALIDFVDRVRIECHSLVPTSTVLWYDAVTTEGRLVWQNQLNRKNAPFFHAADGIFLNYTWTPALLHSSATFAATVTAPPRPQPATTPSHSLQSTSPSSPSSLSAPSSSSTAARAKPSTAATAARRHTSADVYAGIDVFGRGTFGGGKMSCLQAVDAIKDARVSIALFAPGWTFECTPPDTPFLQHQLRFWHQFEGAVSPRRLETRNVFSTHFTLGRGRHHWINGKRVGGEWANLSRQDVMPTFSFEPSPTNPFPRPPATRNAFRNACMQVEERAAFTGGSCLSLSYETGPTWAAGDALVFRLFHTRRPLSSLTIVQLTTGTLEHVDEAPDVSLQFVLTKEDRGAVQYLRLPTCPQPGQHAFQFCDERVVAKFEGQYALPVSRYERTGDGTLTFTPVTLNTHQAGTDDDDDDGVKKEKAATTREGKDLKVWRRNLALPPTMVVGDGDDTSDVGDGKDDDGGAGGSGGRVEPRWFTSTFVIGEGAIAHQSIAEIRAIVTPRTAGCHRVLLGGLHLFSSSHMNNACKPVVGLRASHIDWHDVAGTNPQDANTTANVSATAASLTASLHLTLSWAEPAPQQTTRFWRVYANTTSTHAEDASLIGTAHVPCFRVVPLPVTARAGARACVRLWVQPVSYAALTPALSTCAHVDIAFTAPTPKKGA